MSIAYTKINSNNQNWFSDEHIFAVSFGALLEQSITSRNFASATQSLGSGRTHSQCAGAPAATWEGSQAALLLEIPINDGRSIGLVSRTGRVQVPVASFSASTFVGQGIY